MSIRSSAGKRGAMEVRKAMWALSVGVVVGRSLRKRRSLPVGGGVLGCGFGFGLVCGGRGHLGEGEEVSGEREG